MQEVIGSTPIFSTPEMEKMRKCENERLISPCLILFISQFQTIFDILTHKTVSKTLFLETE